MSSSIVGVDIGTTGIRAVEVQDADKARPRIVKFAEADVPDGAIVRGEVIEAQTVAASLKRMWATHKFSTKRVVLGMGNQNVLARDHTVPLQSYDRIKEVLPFQVQDMLPVPVADAILDFYPTAQVQGEHGPMAEGLLIAAVKQSVLANVNAVESAKLTPAEVDLIPFALSRLLLTRPKVPGAAAVVDFGGSCTTVVVTIDGVPRFMRMIPTGGIDITETLRARLEIEPEHAEQLKRNVSLVGEVTNQQEQQAREIIHELSDELLRGLRNTINYVSSVFPRHSVSGLHVCGGASLLGGLTQMLAHMTGLPVGYVDPFTGVAVSRNLTTDGLRASQFALTVALGLAVGSRA